MAEEQFLHERTQECIHRLHEWSSVFKGRSFWPRPVPVAPIYSENLFTLPAWEDVPSAISPRPEFPTPTEPAPFDAVELQIQFPESAKIARTHWEALLWLLASEHGPIGFELVHADGRTHIQFVCDESHRIPVKGLIAEYLPGVHIREGREHLIRSLYKAPKDSAGILHEYGLEQDVICPLLPWQPPDADPLNAILDAFNSLGEGESGVYQVLLAAPDIRWQEGLKRICESEEPVPFAKAFGRAEKRLAKQKLSRPLIAAVVRLAFRTTALDTADSLFNWLDFKIRFEQEGSNALFRLSNAGYYAQDHLTDLVMRRTRRTGMLLSFDELFALVHLPLERAADARLRLFPQKTKQPRLQPIPENLDHGGVLGYNSHRDEITTVALSQEHRSRHTYIIGVSGTGKSTLLFTLIQRDMIAEHGCAVIDPHGDLIEKLLEYVPEERLKDVVVIDPSDEEYPVGFNILFADSDAEKNLLASDLVAVFRRLSTSWGDQMNVVFGNAIQAFLEHPQGGTLIDLRNFLVDKEYRMKFLAGVQDEGVRYYWTKEFPLLTGKPQGPILTRLDAFLRPKMIRNMVAQKENKLDFPALMRDKKIVLMKLAHGAIGEENAYLLGSLFVSRFYQAALGRQNLPEKERSLFNLYIDEFHNFITPSIASILSGGRKYGLGLTLAHQELRQLWSRDEQVASSVLANPATRVCFRTGEWDAQKLAEGFSFFDAKDIQSLKRGDAICRIDTTDNDFNLTTIAWDMLLENKGREWAEQVKAGSRERYAVPRASLAPALPPVEEQAIPEPAPPLSPPPTPKPARVERPVSAPVPPQPEAEPPAVSVPVPGKGGQQHKYLQEIVKRLGEERGFLAEIEKAVLDGAGSIDVSLIRSDRKIACEISITTSPTHEIGNAQKCLACGYDAVALISPNPKTLMQLKRLASELEEEARAKLHFLTIDEFIDFLDAQGAAESSSESTVKGWKVKANYKPPTPEEMKRKKHSISQTIAAALKRLKGE